ncbi:MAG TPA: ABC transporter permease [Candidatus Monoglobus merdigallinarum]|uniref:ABC transporter permease n=1 Tax=Candidatus Monoglobus merdigallinarum TaxID=2838698 RepID=A0A9D1PPY2_9FIRM|nr:ABC transporter permease [Candidatus Monoglobus merdigallinarum]
MIELLIIGILEQGFIYGIMAMGVYITYTILDFPDLSVDGTFPLGIAVCFVLIKHSANPWLALLAAFAAGCIAGAFTGIFNVKLKIRNLLCGILTMTALYSINYGIVGQASDFLLNNSVTIFSQTEFLFKGHAAFYSKLAVIIVIALAAKFALDWYMRTKSGFLLRSVGDNESLVITLAQNPGTIKIIGLSIANGLVALSGAVYCQYSRAFNVGSGTGTVVMGLAAVIIGVTVFKKLKFMRITTGVIFGMIVYKACISIALAAGLRSQDTNLMITVLFIATLVINEFFLKKKKTGVRLSD